MISSPTSLSAVPIQQKTKKIPSAASAAMPPAGSLPPWERHSRATECARLIPVTIIRRLMAKPCTPHLHSAGCALLRAANPQCTFLWVGLREGYLFSKKRYPSLVYAPCLQGEHFNDYFLKLSLRVTDRLNTRCSAVQSLLSRQKYPRRMNWKLGAVLPFFSVLS